MHCPPAGHPRPRPEPDAAGAATAGLGLAGSTLTSLGGGPSQHWETHTSETFAVIKANFLEIIDNGGVNFFQSASDDPENLIGTLLQDALYKVWKWALDRLNDGASALSGGGPDDNTGSDENESDQG